LQINFTDLFHMYLETWDWLYYWLGNFPLSLCPQCNCF